MPAPNPAPKSNAPKKSPGGIPIWGWVAAGVVGLLLAYFLTRKSGATSDTGSTESDQIPSGSDSGSGGGVVAPPPPKTTTDEFTPTPGTTQDQPPPGDTTTWKTDPGTGFLTLNQEPTAPTTSTTVFGAPVNLLQADSYFPNANFQTSPYVNKSGTAVVGPGGPVIDYESASAPPVVSYATTPALGVGQGMPSPPGYPATTTTNPNILPHGQVVD